MALSAGDKVDVYTGMIRGLEADLLRAQVVGTTDDGQAQRCTDLQSQLDVATQRLDDAQTEAAAEEEARLQALRDEAIAAVQAADPNSFLDDYTTLTKDQLLERASLKGIASQIKSSDTKDDITVVLRANDLRGTL